MTRRIIAAIATITLAVGLAVAAPPASATSTTHTLAQTEAKLTGVSVGPNANTYWGEATLNSTWTSYLDCHSRRHYMPRLTITDHNPTLAPLAPTTMQASPSATCTPGIAVDPSVGPIHPDSWFNPASWNWSKIWGSLWDLISKCINGAANGVISNLSVAAAATAITGGGSLALTPDGLVAVAIGSCFAKINW